MKKTALVMLSLFVALVCILPLQAFAQQGETILGGKKGTFHIDKQVRVGGKLLKAGMYQVQHLTEGIDHFIIFREIKVGYRNNMGNQTLGDEIARVKCTIESVGQKMKNTKLILQQNAAGEKEVVEVWVKGETFKHILQS